MRAIRSAPSIRRRRSIKGDEPVTASTALLLCIRNELPDRVIRNLEPMLAGIAASGYADRFHIYVLSDTSDATVAAAEDRQFATLADAWRGKIPVTYRRREKNTGFKAGNIRDFCERWGAQHELAVTLDADSFMTPEAMLRLVRIMQANPQLGILQSLVVGLPSTSAFARLFQFGMRLGMRSYTTGATWWQGDCGPYWGHNGVFRIAPFFEHCHLPPLPADALFGGEVLSHDQIEAVLMRRAGYEVRVMPVEDNSWEENPPTLVEFLRRDLRWCQGNMQYWYFLGLPGLKFVSRYQLVFALLMFLGSPAWIGMLVLGTLATASANNLSDIVEPTTAIVLFPHHLRDVVHAEIFHRRGCADARRRRAARSAARRGSSLAYSSRRSSRSCSCRSCGSATRCFWSACCSAAASAGSGRRATITQSRSRVAIRNFWAQTLLGVASLVILAMTHPAAIPIASFIAAGLALSIPLAILTSSPQLGDVMARIGLCGLPEERDVPPALRSLVRAGATPQPA